MLLRISGFSFIEVLVSLFIFSFVILGLDAVQVMALRKAKSAYYFSVATQQLQVIIGKLSITSDLQTALHHWNEQNQIVLPQGSGKILGNYPSYQIQIYWGDTKLKNCPKNIVGLSGCLKINLDLA